MRFTVLRAGSRDLRRVLALWAVLLCGAIAAIWALNANALRVINHIEYVKAGRWQRMTALYVEGRKRAVLAMEKAQQLNATSQTQVLLPATDPDFIAAVDLYQRALALDPRDTFDPDRRPHYEILGNLYAAAGDQVNQARALIRAFICNGDWKNAESYANALLARDPKDATTWGLAAEIHLRAGRIANAEAAVSRMEAAGGNSADVHTLWARLALQKKQPEQALREFRTVVEKDPERVDERKRAAGLLVASGQLDAAIGLYRDGLAHGGNNDGNYMHLYGTALLQAGRNKEALGALERAAALEPQSAPVQWDLARAYARAGKSLRANSAMQNAFRLDPKLKERVFEK